MLWRRQNYEILPALSVGGKELRVSLQRVTAGWFFGVVWMVGVGGATIINCGFLAGFNDFHWGLLTSLTFIASLTQLPASQMVESSGLRKMQFMWLMGISRLMWALVGLAPIALLYCPPSARGLIAWAIIFIIFASRLLEHMAVPAWMSWMADLIPSRVRGGYFARRNIYCLISQLIASVGFGVLFDKIISPDQRLALSESRLYAADLPHLVWVLSIVFVVSALFGAADVFIFGLIREIVPRKRLIKLTLKDVVVKPLSDKRFRCFAGSLATLTFGIGFSAPFFALLCQKYYQMSYLEMMIVLTVCGPAGSIVSSKFWARVMKSWGPKRVLIVSIAGASSIAWLWLVTPKDLGWLGGLWSFFAGIAWAGIGIAKVSLELDFSEREGGSSYVAANNAIGNAAGAVAGVAAGIIAQAMTGFSMQLGPLGYVNYHVMLLISGVIRFGGLIWLAYMPSDPVSFSQSSRVRRAAANAYFHVPTMLFAPMRLASRGARMMMRWYGPMAEKSEAAANGKNGKRGEKAASKKLSQTSQPGATDEKSNGK